MCDCTLRSSHKLDGSSDKKHFNDMEDKICWKWLIHSSTPSPLVPPSPILSFEIISTLEQICRLQQPSNDRTWRDVVMADLCTHKRNNTLLIRPARAALLIYSYITTVVFHWVNQIVMESSLTVTTADHWYQLGDDIWASSCVLQSKITYVFMWLDQSVVTEGNTPGNTPEWHRSSSGECYGVCLLEE